MATIKETDIIAPEGEDDDCPVCGHAHYRSWEPERDGTEETKWCDAGLCADGPGCCSCSCYYVRPLAPTPAEPR
jgi:hypothetical protein